MDIEVRAWDNFNGCFHYATMEDLLDGYHPLDIRVAAQEGQTEKPELFTGLRDQDGKKIFEGDIVKTNTINIFGKCVHDNGKFIIMDKIIGPILPTWHECKIIGNIHENPGLIK